MDIRVPQMNFQNVPVERFEYPDLLKEFYKPQMLRNEQQLGQANSRKAQIAAALAEKYGAPQAEAELEGMQLGNDHKRITNTHLDRHELAKIALMEAQAHNQERLGRGVSAGGGGSAGGGTRSGNKYYGIPALAKLTMQQHEIDSGFLPGSNGSIPLTPEQQAQYSDQNQLAMMKLGSDAKTRERTLFAKNIEKTIDATDVNDLVGYSGPKGQTALKVDQGLDLIGQAPEKYKKYQEAMTAVSLEAKELRQFFGVSITPEMDRQITELTNPTGWNTSPDVAKRKIQKLRDTVKKQLGTYQGALAGPDPYRQQKMQQEVMQRQQPQQGVMQPVQLPQGMVRGILNGKPFTLPADKAQDFMNMGGQVIE